MIDFEWRSNLAPADEPELRELLDTAAAVDQEAGFPQLSIDDPFDANTAHLLVWLIADDRLDPGHHDISLAPVLAAYMRIEPLPDGTGEVSYVVRPEFRSRGITTLLLEKLGLDTSGTAGWQGTGASRLRIWARGDHPAANRISLRFNKFGISVTEHEWRLLMPLRPDRAIGDGAAAGPAVRLATGEAELQAAARLWADAETPPDGAAVLIIGDEVTGALWADAYAPELTEYGYAGRLGGLSVTTEGGPVGDQVRALLIAGAEHLRDEGLRVASIVVEAADSPPVHEARLLGFMHDRTDVQYTVGA